MEKISAHAVAVPPRRAFFHHTWFVAAALGCCLPRAHGSLSAYDAVIATDAAGGLIPVARLTTPLVLTGSNRGSFNFGNTSGDVSMEFILEGNPGASTTSAYLAVGTNTSSNLRYEQFNNTGQLGFTQLGVLDYRFSPVVPSPVPLTHIVYLWHAGSRVMELYLNGSLAGACSGVSASFAMPAGPGYLGASPNNTETMTGTIHRVTVYDDLPTTESIQRR